MWAPAATLWIHGVDIFSFTLLYNVVLNATLWEELLSTGNYALLRCELKPIWDKLKSDTRN